MSPRTTEAIWTWTKMQAVRPQAEPGEPEAALDVEGKVDERSIHFTFLTTAHTPDGVDITLELAARWLGGHFREWDESEIERFLVEHAAVEAFERIDEALMFLGGHFLTPVPLFSSEGDAREPDETN